MTDKREILDEIIENASELPYESQRYILDMIKAMLFTREMVEKEQSAKSKGTYEGKETA